MEPIPAECPRAVGVVSLGAGLATLARFRSGEPGSGVDEAKRMATRLGVEDGEGAGAAGSGRPATGHGAALAAGGAGRSGCNRSSHGEGGGARIAMGVVAAAEELAAGAVPNLDAAVGAGAAKTRSFDRDLRWWARALGERAAAGSGRACARPRGSRGPGSISSSHGWHRPPQLGQPDRRAGRTPRPYPEPQAVPHLREPIIDTNVLYYGDNLEILRRYIPDESVDLIYLDPPFNSNQSYNVIFRDESGRRSDAQVLAFEDTWHWGPEAERTYAYLTETARHQGRVPSEVATLIAALRAGIRENQMLAYLVEMAVRLVELRRVLKPTGSLYLHCDPTASHYLKLVLDATFGVTHFRNEVIWKRTSGHSDAERFGNVHDVILVFSRGDAPTWATIYQPYDPAYVDQYYRYADKDGRRFMSADLGAAGLQGGGYEYEWRSVVRLWRCPRETMERYEAEGRIFYTKNGIPRLKRYLDESKGMPGQDVWTDIESLRSWHRERLGYPTQKPEALLERILEASSRVGDIVLDPFCGCGTALVAAEKLDRKWVGIDITYLSIAVMRARLMDTFGLADVPVIGQPTEVEGARQLSQSPEGRYQFQWWALGLVDAQPVGGVERKGADQGIDGKITFSDERHALQTVLVSVKSGHVGSAMVRDLKGTLERERAAMGVFITLEEPSRDMALEASTAGLYHSDLWNRDYPRVQILSIRELLGGKHPDLPASRQPTFQKAPRNQERGAAQERLFDQGR